MDKFIGSWKHVGSENLEDYMQAVGITDEMRAVAHAINPSLTISQEGDTVVINLQTIIGSRNGSFKLGEEFHMKTTDGRDCKVVVSLDGDKLIEVSKWDDTESSTLYEIKDGQLIKTLTHQDAVAVRTFEKA
ncbi:fatty acid-binding protein, brain-like [Pangasianodon hypophthalmus]|uniref:fatty acid-binding protein, brain-like n=1 Tax=Pangasianodon hypophthalmus TaxID=310915 RepID=UPI0014808CE6|nr:fatty acid-binding protein, brain-like [Pangasianodon hypophthalmus]